MEKSARIYNCARCHHQTVICNDCDRGNIYCGPLCSQQSRAQNHRKANQSYQKSLRGRQKHAARQRRYHERNKNKVTDQGSPDLFPNDLLPNEPSGDKLRSAEPICCHFCGEIVSSFLRNEYLRHSREHKSHHSSSWPLGP